MPLPRPITIANTRYLKDDVNSYSPEIIEIAKRLDANHILLSFTGTSGREQRTVELAAHQAVRAAVS